MTGKTPSLNTRLDRSVKADRTLAGLGVKHAVLSVALLTPFMLGSLAYGQAAPPAGGGQPAPPAGGTATDPAASAGTTSPDYKIAEYDVLDVQVIDHPDVNRKYDVPIEGVIDVPLVGELNVLGMTLRDLKKTLKAGYAKQFYHPDIILAARPADMFVDVIGVAHNGKFPLKHNERVLQLIAEAGGLPIDRPENYKATLIRNKNGDAIPIHLDALYKNDPAENLLLAKDDTLYIEEKAAQSTTVQVIGQVMHPGAQPEPRDGSLITVLQSAGGPTTIAALSQARIVRGDKVIPVDLRNYAKTGFIPVETIQAGDELVVPENKLEYFITGAAGNTGPKTYPEDKKLTVFSAWEYAGGSTEGVDLSKVVLSHPDPGSKQVTRSIVDIDHMQKTGDHSADLAVVPGDTIQIPPAKSRKGLSAEQIFTYVGGFATIIGVYILLR